ncbi:DNRLRE domain-containing protein [Bacillus sp. CLL-7-23]|uniref:DNRLRE domain-containing protein n=1 Tax=Bacillus changyiensis TaxID=3004103 RepID=A0ABT4WYT1_9BACI|nr:DNRLRE domain-containing protein [Bacillus changyiensis]MDA7025189.1 DNRLRE domain-containing protein [Bacillus changyiensis]
MKKKSRFMWKSWIARFLVLLLIISSAPLEVFAAEHGEEKSATKDVAVKDPNQPIVDPLFPKKDLDKSGEIISERTENSKLFYEGDGVFKQEVFLDSVHTKKTANSDWEEISPELKTVSNKVETENAVLSSSFHKQMKNGLYATFEHKDHQVTYSIIEAKGPKKTPIHPEDVKAENNSNELTYKNVFPNIDFQTFTFNENTKEDLVLHKYEGYNSFTFQLKTDLSAEIQEDGSIELTDKNGKQILTVPKPFMTDSNLDEGSGEVARSEDVKYTLEKNDQGYLLHVTADEDWLKDPQRVYPVSIDPSTSLSASSDTFVMSAYPTTNYSTSTQKWDANLKAYVLKTGYYDKSTGTNYAFMKFNNLKAIQNMKVTKATLKTYVAHSYYGTKPTGLWLDTVNSSYDNAKITWNNKPGSKNIGKTDVHKGQWASFDVTAAVKSWNSGVANNGFKFHTNGNGKDHWKKLISSANSKNKPYIEVTYTIPQAEAPTTKAYSNGNQTGYFDIDWKKIEGAKGYKLWMYNGKEYQAISVGNTTSWSTKGKNIWPTKEEIASGKYKLHIDGKGGTELALDPSTVYKNSGGNDQGSKNYWVAVSAVFDQGEGAMSQAAKPILPNIARAGAPDTKGFNNHNGTGYFDLSWKAVSRATGYKVQVFNGKSYETLDVGNRTSWTTKGKNIWLTKAEISAGKYALHLTDGKGAELPIHPGSTYKNAGGNANQRNYSFKIIAYNKDGEAVASPAANPLLPDLARPKNLSGYAYTNTKESQTGYVNLQWDKVKNAKGYKINIYNGKEYQSYDVGDVDHWTTQNKKIWPTEDEIKAGRYQLHLDGKGGELALDPSPVYANANGDYKGRKNYSFSLTAYDPNGETLPTPPFNPSFREGAEFLGTEDYWSITEIPDGQLNGATGNVIVSEEDISIDGRGPGLGLSRTYNSLDSSDHLFGQGWYADAETKVIATDNGAIYIDEDATTHVFTKKANGTYQPPTGVYLELTETADEFLLKTKDQTTTSFSKKDGKLQKIVDGHHNTTVYNYNEDQQLTSIQDASGRTMKLTYDEEGHVTSITGPKGKKVSYEYETGLLKSVTDTDGTKTAYEYDETGLLIKQYSQNSTEEKPVFTEYQYSGHRLEKAINAKKETYVYQYDTAKKTLLMTQPNGRKVQYSYNEAGNPIQIVDDVEGLKITTNTKYEGNNVIEETDPNDVGTGKSTENYEYDKNGNIIAAKDAYGTETYHYNNNNDVTKMKDTEGNVTDIAYDGLDAVSETDQSGKSSSAAVYDKYGNLVQSSKELAASTNLLKDASFEEQKFGWDLTASKDSGKVATLSEKSGALSGSKALEVTSQSTSAGTDHGYVSATQEVVLEPDTTYTLSGKIKTDLAKARAYFNIDLRDTTNKRIQWINNSYSTMAGKNDWTKRQITFTTPANAGKAVIYMEVDHHDKDGKGKAWFDEIQLEKGEVSSSYNPVQNSSFLEKTANWSGSGGNIDAAEGFNDDFSLKASRNNPSQTNVIYKQTVEIGQSTTDKPFYLTLTGMSKADGVKFTSETDYSLQANVTYADGSTGTFNAKFPAGTQEWNRAAVVIPKTKPLKKVDISVLFQKSATGTVWFDDIRLSEGSILTKTTYDENGNYAVKEEDELGFATAASYDEVGKKTSETDAKGEKTTYEYDQADQLTKMTLSNGTSILRTYDKEGNELTKTIRAGSDQTYKYEYDVMGKLVKTTDPLGHVLASEYDANSNLIKTISPNGNEVSLTYDGTDRVKSKAYNGTEKYNFTYDKNGNETSVINTEQNITKNRTFDNKNRLTELTDRGGSQSWTYPSDSDKLKTFSWSHGGQKGTNSFTYNKLDQMIQMKDNASTYSFDYDENGNVLTFITGNGSGASFSYDERNLVSILHIGTNSSDTILTETYEYDANGNRTTIEKQGSGKVQYEYGKLDQLVKETHPDGTVIQYTYDGFGNRTNVKTTKNSSTKTVNASFNIMNQLTKVNGENITYDKNGNRTSDSRYTYTWDAEDNLTAITKKGEAKPFATYKYDERGYRIQKTVNGKVTNYLYDGDGLHVLYETNEKNEVTKSYTYGDTGQLLAYRENGKQYFYHYNAHGDVIALTDNAGKIVAKYEYDTWGTPTKTEESSEVKGNPYRYAGYRYDEETGLYYLIARYYEPENGVFLSLDPDPGSDGDALDQNGYTYANNNPVMKVDPDGHWFWLAVNAGFAAYDGYKAYRSGKGWRGVLWAAASNFGPGKIFKFARRVKQAKHSVYVLKKGKKVVYVGRTKNLKQRAAAHRKNHPDAEFRKKRSGLTYAQARGLEHRYYLKYGGKKKLRNKIRPISKKNKKYKHYMSASRRFYK